jgi:hypothetical protein
MLFKYSEASANAIAKPVSFKIAEGFTHGLGESQEGRKERREFQK